MDGSRGEHQRVSFALMRPTVLTLSVGDGEWKSSGVTAEPEVTSKLLEGQPRCDDELTSRG